MAGWLSGKIAKNFSEDTDQKQKTGPLVGGAGYPEG